MAETNPLFEIPGSACWRRTKQAYKHANDIDWDFFAIV